MVVFRRLPPWARWCLSCSWAVVIWQSLTFSPRSTGEPDWLDRLVATLAPLAERVGADKLIHGALFAVLALLVLRSVRAAGPIERRWRAAVVLAVSLYGGATELAQAAIPARTASWGDFVADLVGAAFVGWLVGRVGPRGRGGSIPTPPATPTHNAASSAETSAGRTAR